MRMNYERGFTLIEILIVIAIMGILASVVFGAIANVRNKAKIIAFKSEIKSLQSMLVNVCNERDIVLATDTPAAGFHNLGTAGDLSCMNDGTFSIVFTPTANGPIAECVSATVTESTLTTVAVSGQSC